MQSCRDFDSPELHFTFYYIIKLPGTANTSKIFQRLYNNILLEFFRFLQHLYFDKGTHREIF